MNTILTVLGSGSAGNGYILDCDGQQLIIECGVPFKECNKELNGDISGVVAAICTHGHRDHLGYVDQYSAHGITIYSNTDVHKTFGYKEIVSNTKYRIGGFAVIGLKVPHGNTECFSFIIDTPDKQRCLFATDLEDFPYSVKGISHIFCEANYSEELRLEALMKNPDIRSASGTHMELSTCIKVLNRLKSPSLQSVTLLHLSDALSDAEGFKKRVYNEIGIDTYVAEKGFVLNLKKSDF